jgi:hypothetical protein
MLASSDGRHEQIVNSFNLFVDSAKDVGGKAGKGDSFSLQLGAESIQCADGQFLRLTLQEFSMFTNFYGVNTNNGRFRLTNDVQATELLLPFQNYKNVSDVAASFSEALRAQLQTDVGGGTTCTVSNLTPPSGTALNATSDRIISFDLDFSAVHGLTVFRVQCFGELGDSYVLLGGNRIDDPTSTTSSFNCEIISTTKLRLTAFYPAQRSTEQYLYLRCAQQNNGIETAVLSDATGPYLSQTLTSNILAKIPIDLEACSYFANSDREFFMNLQQRRLSTLTLFLTDSRNRPIGRPPFSGSGTAAGSTTGGVLNSELQSTQGNLFFTCTVRVDVVQVSMPARLHAPPPPVSQPRLNNRGTLIWQDHGADKFDTT